MNCYQHPENAAVAQCGVCGAGICTECIDVSEYRIDNKPLCRSCNYATISDFISKGKSDKTKTIIKLVINSVFIVLGLAAFSSSPETGVILFAVGGIPTAWKMLSSTPKEKALDRIDDAIADVKYGEGSGFMASIFRFIFKLVFTVIIGAVAAPILVIVNIVKIVKANKVIAENEFLLANIEGRGGEAEVEAEAETGTETGTESVE